MIYHEPSRSAADQACLQAVECWGLASRHPPTLRLPYAGWKPRSCDARYVVGLKTSRDTHRH